MGFGVFTTIPMWGSIRPGLKLAWLIKWSNRKVEKCMNAQQKDTYNC